MAKLLITKTTSPTILHTDRCVSPSALSPCLQNSGVAQLLAQVAEVEQLSSQVLQWKDLHPRTALLPGPGPDSLSGRLGSTF